MDSTKKIVRYNLSTRISAPNIGFAIGPFEMIKYTPTQLQEELYMTTELDDEQQKVLTEAVDLVKNIYVFAPPGRLEDLNNTCNFLIHVSTSRSSIYMHIYCISRQKKDVVAYVIYLNVIIITLGNALLLSKIRTVSVC